MNYFTPTQERIALVETASYNQRLLALRARRLAQQRMDHAHRIASIAKEQQEAREQGNEFESPCTYLGSAPYLTEQSDDEDYELEEIFAPVPYQKGYWLTAKRAQQERAAQQRAAQQKQQQSATATNRSSNALQQTATANTATATANIPALQKTAATAQIKHEHGAYSNNARPNSSTYAHPQHKIPQYKPAMQHHPSYQSQPQAKPAYKPAGGPPALV
eukprot:CAMPEP_0197033612 /NCGR_PEP_ID=MMETSP1384-20130603/11981_1 /TAXON_ID=29189 /ORGANISM="Ammonia sp." /LENGTH=217 /DNA_ID=CAMNT_0042463451 /DNA_START=69 /DNA_END=722 /DNA_ORIENTATION=-